MKPETIEQIKSDLERTGFASEMKAIQCFTAAYWSSSGGGGFFDRDQNVTREIDLVATRHEYYFLRENYPFHCWFRAVAEVKKSKEPWVVFRQTLIPARPEDLTRVQLLRMDGLPDVSSPLDDAIWEGSLLKSCGWRGTGIYQSFKAPDKPSRWYPAFTKVCKAAEAELTTLQDEAPSSSQETEGAEMALDFIQPIVVLDGPLVGASLTEEGEMEVEEIDAAPFLFDFRTATYKKSEYRVDLVTLNYLPQYVSDMQKLHKAIFDCVMGMIWT